MITLNPSLSLLLASLLVGPASAPQDASAPVPVRLVENGALVEMDLADVSLESFLQASAGVLGPINWDTGQVTNTRLNEAGPQRFERARFREAFDAVMYRHEFLTWDDDAGPVPVISVLRPNNETRYSPRRVPFSPEMIAPDELDTAPAARVPLCATLFTLQHVSANDAERALRPFVHSWCEWTERIAESNQLLVVASRAHLLEIRGALRLLDVETGGAASLGARLGALEERLAALEARLEAFVREARPPKAR